MLEGSGALPFAIPWRAMQTSCMDGSLARFAHADGAAFGVVMSEALFRGPVRFGNSKSGCKGTSGVMLLTNHGSLHHGLPRRRVCSEATITEWKFDSEVGGGSGSSGNLPLHEMYAATWRLMYNGR
eukprot:13720243-Ditylum_brightwellii.AAC.1